MTAHSFDPTLLREYDIRGIFGQTLSTDDAVALGRAFGSQIAEDGGSRVAVGYDGRLSSPELEAALVEGLVSTGMQVLRVGLGPTPLLYYAVCELPADGGIMVTGSHNPPDYNGFKMMLASGSVFGSQIQELGQRAAEGRFVEGQGSEERSDLMTAYVDRLLRDFKGAHNLKIAWDGGNGAAGDAMRALTKRLPGEHILLNAEIDGTFPAHHPDPTVAKNLEQLIETVQREGCDLGFAFDGDGDRIGAVDGQGRILWGDQLMLLLARDVLKAHPGATIIADVKASQMLFDGIAELGGQPLMWKTGHSLIKAKMKETGSPFAGEMSAHLFFADHFYGYDDALYGAVRLLNALETYGDNLAAFRDSLPQLTNTPEIRFPVDEARKFDIVEEVAERVKKSGAEVIDVDGVRVRDGDGWWLLRASNTQDVLVARCEAPSDTGLQRLKLLLGEQLRQSGLEPPEF
ncbi:phosphoglucomutase/phosphomannomutase PgmG [Algihabitans albus]|uniref:phosphoglucomutase/phosphomannomutase PgmG n=1 Tax=Algihabitans albus TaxID=2164067 RepID=UPI000E5D830F|nr:phosphomannomutase/phosphoglucomutase [Algihabitans albus]